MGAWGHESFENDDALDWVADLESTGSAAIEDALDGVTDDAEEYIEAPECSMALAAAETVAALLGRPSATLPADVQVWAAGQPKPSEQIVAKATAAVKTVLADSELRALWEESEYYDAWRASAADLLTRLAGGPASA